MTELKNINVKENTVGSQVTTKDSPIIKLIKKSFLKRRTLTSAGITMHYKILT